MESRATMDFECYDDRGAPRGYDFAPEATPTAAKGVARGLILVGPGKHFGEELIRRFLAEGYRVGVVSAREATVDTLRDTFGETIEIWRADITDTDFFGDTLSRLAESLGSVNCLIYNPKQSIAASGLKTQPDELEHAMKVNVTGALVAIQAVLPRMSHAANASVILTGGGYKDKPDVEKFALAVGKAGLHGMVRALRDPLRRRGVALKTVVIDGMVRRHATAHERSSQHLADFYWEVFARRAGQVHRFPTSPIPVEDAQLSLPV